jgi:hypothetical protein
LKRLGIVVSALVVMLAALPAEASAQRCRDVIDTGPTGFDPADSDGLRTKSVGCPLARKLAAKAGLIAVRQRVQLHGFACRDLGMRRDGTFPQRCRRGSQSVFWVLRNAERSCPATVFIAVPAFGCAFGCRASPAGAGGSFSCIPIPFRPAGTPHATRSREIRTSGSRRDAGHGSAITASEPAFTRLTFAAHSRANVGSGDIYLALRRRS